MMRVAVLVLCVSAAVQTNALLIKHRSCKGSTPEADVLAVDISPCKSDPCYLSRGSTYMFTVNFTTGATPPEVTGITTLLYGIIHGVKVLFPGFNQTNACEGCNLRCPLQANTEQAYKLSFYVDPKRTIDIDTLAEIELVDKSTQQDLLCQQFEVVVVN